MQGRSFAALSERRVHPHNAWREKHHQSIIEPLTNSRTLAHLVLRDEPTRVVWIFVHELLGFVRAREQEDRSVAGLQERPSWAPYKQEDLAESEAPEVHHAAMHEIATAVQR